MSNLMSHLEKLWAGIWNTAERGKGGGGGRGAERCSMPSNDDEVGTYTPAFNVMMVPGVGFFQTMVWSFLRAHKCVFLC